MPIQFTLPATTSQASHIRIGIYLHEADLAAAKPGELHASLSLITDDNRIIFTQELGPEDLTEFATLVKSLKENAMATIGAEKLE